MKIAAQLLIVQQALDVWAKEIGGGAEIAADPFHLLSMLQTKPGGFRCFILFQGETKRGEYEESGIVDRNFSVIVSRNRGLTANPGDALFKGEKPLFEIVEQARDVVRGIQFEDATTLGEFELTTEVTPNFLGSEVFAVEEKPLDAYQLNFQIGCQLPAA